MQACKFFLLFINNKKKLASTLGVGGSGRGFRGAGVCCGRMGAINFGFSRFVGLRP